VEKGRRRGGEEPEENTEEPEEPEREPEPAGATA
jgi:hypothetical protein